MSFSEKDLIIYNPVKNTTNLIYNIPYILLSIEDVHQKDPWSIRDVPESNNDVLDCNGSCPWVKYTSKFNSPWKIPPIWYVTPYLSLSIEWSLSGSFLFHKGCSWDQLCCVWVKLILSLREVDLIIEFPTIKYHQFDLKQPIYSIIESSSSEASLTLEDVLDSRNGDQEPQLTQS